MLGLQGAPITLSITPAFALGIPRKTVAAIDKIIEIRITKLRFFIKILFSERQ